MEKETIMQLTSSTPSSLGAFYQFTSDKEHGEVIYDHENFHVQNSSLIGRKFKNFTQDSLVQTARKETLLAFKGALQEQLRSEDYDKLTAKTIVAHILSDRKIDYHGYLKVQDVKYVQRHLKKYQRIHELADHLRLIAKDPALIECLEKHHPGLGERIGKVTEKGEFWLGFVPFLSSVNDSIKAYYANKTAKNCHTKLGRTQEVQVLRAAVLTTLEQYYTDKRNAKVVSAVTKPLLFILTAITGGVALATESAVTRGVSVTEPIAASLVQKALPKLVQTGTHKVVQQSAKYMTNQVQRSMREISPVPSELRQSTELVHMDHMYDGVTAKGTWLRTLCEAFGFEQKFENSLADPKTCKALMEYLELRQSEEPASLQEQARLELRDSFYQGPEEKVLGGYAIDAYSQEKPNILSVLKSHVDDIEDRQYLMTARA